jgi:hypothetical protein
MPLTLTIAVLLALSPGTAAERTSPDGSAPIPTERTPIAALAGHEATPPAEFGVRDTRVEVQRGPSEVALQQETNRSFWFVVGALVAVAVILAVTL